MTYEYLGEVTNVVDGDTLDITIDLGLRIISKQRVRLYGIDTPERGQPGFTDATARLKELVLGKVVLARTIKPTTKYGLWGAAIEVVEGDVTTILINEGLGVPYFGGTKL